LEHLAGQARTQPVSMATVDSLSYYLQHRARLAIKCPNPTNNRTTPKFPANNIHR
jgi:hypothetical protein